MEEEEEEEEEEEQDPPAAATIPIVPTYVIGGSEYRDFSQIKASQVKMILDAERIYSCNRGNVLEPFPTKLYSILASSSDNQIQWVEPHGRGFRILDQSKFKAWIPHSFRRQLHLYGFQRIKKSKISVAGGALIYHELFLRGRPDLCELMRREKIKNKTKQATPNNKKIRDWQIVTFDQLPYCLEKQTRRKSPRVSLNNKKVSAATASCPDQKRRSLPQRNHKTTNASKAAAVRISEQFKLRQQQEDWKNRKDKGPWVAILPKGSNNYKNNNTSSSSNGDDDSSDDSNYSGGDDDSSDDSNYSGDEVVERMLINRKKDGKDKDVDDECLDYEELRGKSQGIPKGQCQPNTAAQTLPNGMSATNTSYTADLQRGPTMTEQHLVPQQQQQISEQQQLQQQQLQQQQQQQQPFNKTDANVYEGLIALLQHNQLIVMACQHQHQRIQHYLKQCPQQQQQQEPTPVPPTPMTASAYLHEGLTALLQHNQFVMMAWQYQHERIQYYLKQYAWRQPPPVPPTIMGANAHSNMPQQSTPLNNFFQQQTLPPNPVLQQQHPQLLPNPLQQQQQPPPPNHLLQHQPQQQATGYGWNSNPMMQQPFRPVPSPHGGPVMMKSNTVPTPMRSPQAGTPHPLAAVPPPAIPQRNEKRKNDSNIPKERTNKVKKKFGCPYRGPIVGNTWHCFYNCFPITEEDLNNTRYIQDMIYERLQDLEPQLICPRWHIRRSKLKAKSTQTSTIDKKVLFGCTCNCSGEDNIEGAFCLELIFDRKTEESPATLRWNGVGHSCDTEIFQFDPPGPQKRKNDSNIPKERTIKVKKTFGRPYRGPMVGNSWHCFYNCFPITEEDLNNTRYIQYMIYERLQELEPKLICPHWHVSRSKLHAKTFQTSSIDKKVLFGCTCNCIGEDNVEGAFCLELIFDRTTEESPAALRWNGVGHSCDTEVFQFDPRRPQKRKNDSNMPEERTNKIKRKFGRPYRGPMVGNTWHCFYNCFPITEEDLNNTRYIQDMIYERLQDLEPKLICPRWHIRHSKLKAKTTQTSSIDKIVLFCCTCNCFGEDNIEDAFCLELIFDQTTKESLATLRWNGVSHSCDTEIFQFDPRRPRLKGKQKMDAELRFFCNRIDILYEENPDVGMLQIFEIFRKEHSFDSEVRENRKLAESLTNHLKNLNFQNATKNEKGMEVAATVLTQIRKNVFCK